MSSICVMKKTGGKTLPDEYLRPAKRERIGKGAALRASVGSTDATWFNRLRCRRTDVRK
jgi:hypothetical protein